MVSIRDDGHAFVADAKGRDKQVNRKDGQKKEPVDGVDASKSFPEERSYASWLTDVIQVRVQDDDATKNEEDFNTAVAK
jgi:hypothetical protein